MFFTAKHLSPTIHGVLGLLDPPRELHSCSSSVCGDLSAASVLMKVGESSTRILRTLGAPKGGPGGGDAIKVLC